MTKQRMWIGTSVLVAVLIIAFAVIMLTRDSGASDESAALVSTNSPSAQPLDPSPSPTPEGPPAEVVWAGQVCTATAELRAVAQSLPAQALDNIDFSGDLAAQAQAELDSAMSALEAPVAALGFALGSVPVDYAQASQTITDAQRLYAQTQQQVSETQQAVAEIGQAGNALEALLAFGTAVDSGKRAYESGQELLGVLEQIDSDKKLRGAFEQAPECKAL